MKPRKLRLTVAFDGTGYFGWQAQKNQPTVQGILAEAIQRVTGEPVNLVGSGRTDAGTHARALVASFSTLSAIAPASLVRALNSLLPRDIRVLAARKAPSGFDARRSAKKKIYRYQIYRGQVLPPHLLREFFYYPYPIDLQAMQAAAGLFLGEHDFASFAAAQRKTPAAPGEKEPGRPRSTVRRIFRCELRERGPKLLLTVEGSGFLQHMVRNIAGTLLEVGRGRVTPEQVVELFRKPDSRRVRFTAPAHGLVLLKVSY
jgi:tRNA pseudouridine38-40 synthase